MSIRLKRRVGLGCDHVQDRIRELMNDLNVPCFMAQILLARGITDAAQATRFLNPSLDQDWRNPYDIKGMEEGVTLLERAIKDKKRIVVYGDFDLDGISATTVMTRAIRALGGYATPFIPRRFEEGYGMTEASIARLLSISPELVVTVDCGISCKDEAKRLKNLGIEVVITDHHEAASDALDFGDIPVIDPKAEEKSASAILAGVGVALKVVQALGSRFGYPHLWRSYTDFATLGTVADLMPMLDENRALVSDGVKHMNSDPRPCIKALLETCSMQGKVLASTNIGFTLAPRLNAAGRMGSAELALDLLMCDDPKTCSELALKLEELNNERRRIESELSSEAQKIAADSFVGERVIIVAGEGWHEGVKGIVASRLANKYKLPALLFTIVDGQARGSGRSYGDIDLFKAVESQADILTRFGGHSAAVGVTLPADKLDEFKTRLDAYMNSLPLSQFEPMTSYDATVDLSELTLDNVELIERLAPFGQQNPEPVLFAKNVMLTQCRPVGVSKNHLSCVLTDGRARIDGICFHCHEIDSLCTCDGLVNALFTAQIDEWRGRLNVKAMLTHLEPACLCLGLEACIDDATSGFVDGLFDEDARSCAPCEERICDGEHADNKAYWREVASRDIGDLMSQIIQAIIGDNSPHLAQQQMIDLLDSGRSVLGIMATGRGKSLIFQTHAALIALRDKKASLFVYPLRALMSDQAFHLAAQFERFGLVCRVLNGETPQDERDKTYKGIEAGAVDIVLTTPEYLSFHAEEIGRSGKIGFMVVDEAHHIGQARAGTRPAYRELRSVMRALGNPVVLAVTATADDRIASEICEDLGIKDKVIDRASRDNLHIDDQRGIIDKDDYLAHVVVSGEKSIVYVNSREQSVGVARRLRRRIPQLAHMIGFYNAGLSREERTRIERLFRTGAIRTLVATSAFGEGIDIPDIRHVFLYHMPFSDIEFNQMSGRAGRDGKDSWIHLLYGRADVAINKGILSQIAPTRDDLAQVYRCLKGLQAASGGDPFIVDVEDLAVRSSVRRREITPQAVGCGIAVFNELGLIKCERVFKDGAEATMTHVIENAAKVELTDSIRYQEGLEEMSDFMAFRDWAIKCDIHGLLVRIAHPISPDENSEGTDVS